LARDVAGTERVTPSERMSRYLQARTRFFDRVVVNEVGRDVRHFVNVGARYDGRAWR
jgi:O-methyltransferase involved in polyketide biosynthesis